MRIAVTYDQGNVGQHFGATEAFKVYDTENGAVVKSEVVSTDGRGHRELIPVVEGFSAQVVICGNLGTAMKEAIDSMGIKLVNGVTGDADAAVAAYLEGSLVGNPGAVHQCTGDHHH